MPRYVIYSQDSMCFPGCLPEGNGPETNSDTYDTREEALREAKRLCGKGAWQMDADTYVNETHHNRGDYKGGYRYRSAQVVDLGEWDAPEGGR